MTDYKKDVIETSSWEAQDFDAIERDFQEVTLSEVIGCPLQGSLSIFLRVQGLHVAVPHEEPTPSRCEEPFHLHKPFLRESTQHYY